MQINWHWHPTKIVPPTVLHTYMANCSICSEPGWKKSVGMQRQKWWEPHGSLRPEQDQACKIVLSYPQKVEGQCIGTRIPQLLVHARFHVLQNSHVRLQDKNGRGRRRPRIILRWASCSVLICTQNSQCRRCHGILMRCHSGTTRGMTHQIVMAGSTMGI